VIVDADVGILPSDTADVSSPVAVDAVARSADPAQLLDIGVKEIPGILMLIPTDRLFRLKLSPAGEPITAQNPSDGGSRNPTRAGHQDRRQTHPSKLEDPINRCLWPTRRRAVRC
jgi:hypothetical protein